MDMVFSHIRQFLIKAVYDMNELVSIIITTYKRDLSVLRQSVESAKKQTYDNTEIIIIDDNGFKSEFQINNQKEFGNEKRIKYIVNKENKGVQYSRNRGILEANGTYVAFLDDDDIWFSDKIKKQIEVFDESIGMVYCGGLNFYDDDLNNTDKYYNYEYFDRNISFKELLSKGDYIGSTSQVVIRRNCFAKSGMFDCDFLSRQDYEMWLRISKYYNIRCVKEPLFYYREHNRDRVSTNNSNLLNGYYGLLRKYDSDYRHNREGKCRILLKISNLYFRVNILKAMVLYLKASILSPKTVIEVTKRKMKK